MSMVGLFDATFNIYRISSTRTALGGIGSLPVLVGELDGTLQIDRTRSRDEGVGLRDVGQALLFAERSAALQGEDVLYCSEGPNVGSWWSVVAVFFPSRPKHQEVTVKPYVGQKPSV